MAEHRSDRDGSLTLVTFEVAGQKAVETGAAGHRFAVPLDDVLEVIRPPALVRLPLGPPSLEGLAQRDGLAMAVVGLRRALAGASSTADAEAGADAGAEAGATAARIVVVRHRGQPVGLLIDRMTGLVTVPPESVEPVAADGGDDTGIDPALLRGVVREPAALLLDPGALIDREFGDVGRGGGNGGAAALPAAMSPRRADAATGADEVPLLVFRVAGQEFALPIATVAEIVPLPETVTRMPRARAHLLGVMPLRDRLVPLVGLRALFALDAEEPGEVGDGAARRSGRVVVVRTGAGAGSGAPIGVVVDEVREILRLDRSLIDPVPPLMAREAEFEDIDGIARAGGGRLVSVLSAERMFRHGAALADRTGETQNEAGGAGAMTQTGGAAAGQGSVALVVFRLGNAEYGLPVEAVREVLRRPDSVTPLPNAPEAVVGVLTLRGAVVPLIDPHRLLRLPAGNAGPGNVGAARGRVVVVAVGDGLAGLPVDGMSGLVQVPASAIGPAPAVSQVQGRLVHRVATLADGGAGRMILLMDPSALLDLEQLAALLPAQ